MKRYYAVIGRMLWADDDNYAIVYQADSWDEACKMFTAQVYEDHGTDPEEIERLEANGEGVSIDQVLVSDSPMEHA